MGQQETASVGLCGLLARMTRARQVAPRVLRNLVHVGGLGHQQIGVTRQFGYLRGRAAVTGVNEHAAAGAEPQAGIGYPVREQAGLGTERADAQAAAATNRMQRAGARHIPGRSSASTASTAPGSAYTGSGAGGSSRSARARSSGLRSAQWSGCPWLMNTASTRSAVTRSSSRGIVA